jgi:hypothetical protein
LLFAERVFPAFKVAGLGDSVSIYFSENVKAIKFMIFSNSGTFQGLLSS